MFGLDLIGSSAMSVDAAVLNPIPGDASEGRVDGGYYLYPHTPPEARVYKSPYCREQVQHPGRPSEGLLADNSGIWYQKNTRRKYDDN